MEADLEAQGFDRMAKKGQAGADQEPEAAEGEEVDAAAAKAEKGRASYDYLLSMQLWSLTAEKVATLQEEADAAAGEVGAGGVLVCGAGRGGAERAACGGRVEVA